MKSQRNMYLEDYIKKSIYEHPSLYKCDTYEESKLRVLSHVFFCNGNGLNFAHTKDKSKGGYVVDDARYHTRNGDHIRTYDLPFGKAKFDNSLVDDQYFLDKIFYISVGLDQRNAYVSDVCVKKEKYSRKVGANIRVTGMVEPELDEDEEDGALMRRMRMRMNAPSLIEAKCESEFAPSFSEGFNMLEKVWNNKYFLQPDWMDGAVFLVRRALEFFRDPEQVVRHHNYPKDSAIEYDERFFKERREKGGEPAVQELRKTWGYKEGETVISKKNRQWEETKNRSIKFLEDFLKVYG